MVLEAIIALALPLCSVALQTSLLNLYKDLLTRLKQQTILASLWNWKEIFTFNNNVLCCITKTTHIPNIWDIISFNQHILHTALSLFTSYILWVVKSIIYQCRDRDIETSTRDIYTWHVSWHTWHGLHVYLVAELVISVIVGGSEHVIILRPPHGVTRPRPSAVKGVAGALGSQALSHLGVTASWQSEWH